MSRGPGSLACLVLLAAMLTACASVPKDAFKLSPTSLEDRQMQSRKFDTLDQKRLLAAGAGVLQDLGYNIDESNTYLGVLTASKKADAKDTRQIVALVALGILTGTPVAWDEKQKITLCLVIRQSLDDPNASVARITLQRIVWNSQGMISRVETINSPELYQAFFDKLSKAVFLEANQI